MHEALLVPLAHAGHWLWLLYLPPILIVLGSIIWWVVVQRRESGMEAEMV
jgi:cytochrome c-type biogenesis protein CcmH/NrfF